MKTNRLLILTFACALACLSIAGTKLSRMTRTTAIQTNSLFYVVTQSAAGVKFSRQIEADDLLASLLEFPGWPIGGGGGEVTTAQLNAASNTLRTLTVTTSNALRTDITSLQTADSNLQGATNGLHSGLAGLIIRAITNIDQSRKLYVSPSGDNTTAQRGRLDKPFRDPKAAENAAQAGDLVHWLPGDYSTNGLGKNGVNHFSEGSIFYTNTATDGGWAIFDDRGKGAITSSIVFLGTIKHRFDPSINSESRGAFYTTNPLTVLYAKGPRLEQGGIEAQNTAAGIWQADGTGFYDFDEIVDPDRGVDFNSDPEESASSFAMAVYWEKGDMFVRNKRMDMTWYGLYGLEPPGNATTYSLYFDGLKLKTDASSFYFVGRTNTYKIWGRFQEAISGNAPLLLYGAGRAYFEFEKLASTSASYAAVEIGSPSPLSGQPLDVWLSGQKVEAARRWVIMNNSNATVRVNVQEWADPGTVTTGMVFNAGQFLSQGGEAVTKNATVIHHAGGTNRISDMLINSRGTNATSSATNNRPAFVLASGLTLKNTEIVTPDNGFSVYAPSSQTVYGDFSSKAPANGNVTTIGDTNYFGGDVVVPVEAYGSGWNGLAEVPVKDAVYDAIEALRSTVIANDTTTSNGIVALELTRNAAVSNALVTLSSNNVRVATGTGGGSVDASGSGGVMTYTVNFPAGGTGSLTTIRTNSGVAGTNLTAFLLTNGTAASPINFAVSSNAAVATIGATVENLSGSGNILASNTPTMLSPQILGTATFSDSGNTIEIAADDRRITGNGYLTFDVTGGGGSIALNTGGGFIAGTITNRGTFTYESNVVYTVRPLVSGGTNLWADGSRGSAFQHTHNYAGVTNLYFTNLAIGSRMIVDVTVSIGSTFGLPQFAESQYIGGLASVRSNCTTRITVHRTDSTTTNVMVETLPANLAGSTFIGLETNAALNTISITNAFTPTSVHSVSNKTYFDPVVSGIVSNITQQKFKAHTGTAVTVSNVVINFNTNRYFFAGLTNLVFTNLVEESTSIADSSSVEVHIKNTIGATMGIVWPAYGAQHGYYFRTNANNPILTTTTLASGAYGVASFTVSPDGTNIFGTFTTWP